jgi:spore photoproduct lyase
MTIKKIIIENNAASFRQSHSILNKLKNVTTERETGELSEFTDKIYPADMDKETLRLVVFKGEFLKPCPGTKEYICCGYQILNIGTNCPMNCSYCILQAYFNQPSLRVFVNLEHELNSIEEYLDSQPEKIFRIGTGEFTDSLALDHICEWSSLLSAFVQKRKNVVLEFKTKTDNIQGLLSSPHREKIIVSWSLNSPDISRQEDIGAPTIERRLKAAKKCQQEGFIVGFHFDPLVHYKEWKEGYLKTLELLDKYVDPKRVIWVSMGCMRFIPALKHIIRKRHLKTHILDGEFINGSDGKMRYFKPIRIEMYSFLKKHLDLWEKDLGLYLCMESSEVWTKSFGWTPDNSQGLSDYLDNRVVKKKLISYLS